jgi:hypothetical protein
VRLLLSGDGPSEREEREVVVVADAELPGRLEGISEREGRKRWERDTGTWDGRAETRKGKHEKYKGIDFLRRSCPVLSPMDK